jgi:photosystem II stability/assembly factor-like uncharacterized protein
MPERPFRRSLSAAALLALAIVLPHAAAGAQQVDTSLFAELHWRDIGPYRGGRTKAAAGIPEQPNVFFIGVVNGGIFKTTDYGTTWRPVFDDQPTGSIGAIAIASSDPDIIYAGSGEGLQRPDLSTGDGIYKSVDGGESWTHLGLRDGQQIPQIVVDPGNPDRLFVAVLGHPYGPNEERGVYRSLDGGRTFERVLYRDEDTGAIDIVMAPDDPNTLYAALWQARQGPWENGAWQGPGSGLLKSTDGGNSWTPIMRGLPTFEEGLGRIGIAIAPSRPSRLFVTVDAGDRSGIYRSDDAGASWRKTSTDARVHNRGSDFAELKVDPVNPDIVYSGSIVAWKSEDAGETWAMLRGAPGGDDYHRFWINPLHPEIILLAADQGAVITVNGGQTWSTWYNQPTAQFYHVTTDNSWPYRVCGGQQESGSACVSSRGNDGQITWRDWRPVGVEEYGYVAPDPLDPDIVYGGKVTRFDYRTGQTQNVAPKPFRSADYRTLRTAPVLFSPVNPRKLYFGANTIWETIDGGNHWKEISPDLTRRDSTVPPNVGVYATERSATARHPGVIYTIAPSPLSEQVIWAGTDDGLIHVTGDGGRNWRNVTPPGLAPWSKVSIMDASHFDTLGAYAAINTFRLDDLRPHIYRTHDGGRTWTHITTGIDSGAVINVVREDPVRRGLLYAGSETGVWVSFDDGDHWQSLRVNMPATSIRDLVVKDGDLVVGTHGRGFWILDDITALRELTPASLEERAHLYRPRDATRVRYSMYTDTPLPVDEPTSLNPPDGATIHYHLAAPARALRLEILDASGAVIRAWHEGVNPDPDPRARGNWPDWWIRPSPVLASSAGLHRFVWNLRYPYPSAESFSYPISAIPGQTLPEPLGPLVAPGSYTVRLTVDGVSYTQRLDVRMDPRVQVSLAELADQTALAVRLWNGINRAADGIARGGANAGALRRLSGNLTRLMQMVDDVDRAPTSQLRAAAAEALSEIDRLAPPDRGGGTGRP